MKLFSSSLVAPGLHLQELASQTYHKVNMPTLALTLILPVREQIKGKTTRQSYGRSACIFI